ncbi:MAG: hypothetical protein GY839_16785 [candidate division Zixibacteria bacterium]|nr:hypothetical protein [candidate division Zixibacteria bacterium]
MGHGDYGSKKLVKKASEEILEIIKPGDIVNQDLKTKWYEFWLKIGFWGIKTYQKDLFGKKSNWQDSHTMMFFNERNTFSVELPKAKFKPIQEYCLSDMSIYRCKLMEMTPEYIDSMMDTAKRMLGSDYDIGQLLDIALRQILGYSQHRKVRFFDFGKKKKVCSVGARVCYEHLYMKKIKPSLDNPPRGKWLFHSVYADKWSEKFANNYKGTDVEATAPAHFANTDYFQNEFELIAKFDNGHRTA